MRSIILTLGAVWLASCAHPVPPELVAARQAYERASGGAAAQVSPAEVHKAAEALRAAEEAYADDPNGYRARDLAYVAERKAQAAEAVASTELERRTRSQADAAYSATQEQLVADTREKLEATQKVANETSRQLSATEAARQEAEAGRVDAERRAAQTLAALQDLAAVTQEQRGMVITLSGSVLFRSGEASLLPEAQSRLDQVAGALLADKDRTLVVEGHTDSQGSTAYNLDLSQRRADEVRGYLIRRGYDPVLIQAHGIGEARPIADNDSPEGRANNRRVEIVIQPRVASNM